MMITNTSAKGIDHTIARKGRGSNKISDRSTEAPVLLLRSSCLVACLVKTGFVAMLGIGATFVRFNWQVFKKISGAEYFRSS